MSTPVFVMPRDPDSWAGAAALWVTVAGWAGATRRSGFDPARIRTPGGMLTEAECLAATSQPPAAPPRSGKRRLPALRELAKDARHAVRMGAYSLDVRRDNELAAVDPAFVWRHHDLFHRAGETRARTSSVPVIEYVHAPVVWEAGRWGVTRPGWSGLLERFGESPQLRQADVVACASEEVRIEVERLGVAAGRTVVSPMGVDPERFRPSSDPGRRATHAQLGDFIIGWVGSFRRFHALDLLLESLGQLRRQGCAAGVVMVGDGAELSRLRALVADQGLSEWVGFAGQRPNTELPALLSTFDAAVVTAAAAQPFHYSPLKLREYMAVALPVVGPRIGEVARLLDDGKTGLLYESGDVAGLTAQLGRLAQDSDLRTRLGKAARQEVLATGTWDAVSANVLKAIGLSGRRAPDPGDP